MIQNVQDSETRILKFLEALSCSAKSAKIIEMKTRGQDNLIMTCEKKTRVSRLIDSNHHKIFAKVNSLN